MAVDEPRKVTILPDTTAADYIAHTTARNAKVSRAKAWSRKFNGGKRGSPARKAFKDRNPRKRRT